MKLIAITEKFTLFPLTGESVFVENVFFNYKNCLLHVYTHRVDQYWTSTIGQPD